MNPESFYTASNSIEDNSSSNFNKTRQLLNKSIYDTNFHERIRNVTKYGHPHEIGPFQCRYSNMVNSPSPPNGVAISSFAYLNKLPNRQMMMLSKDESEAQRAIKKLKLNHSSKMLVQD